ncbi:Chemotaxis signal transduction protein [Hyella patelloides LEGE 07179]|uniref:Chemotaxis signal transduction protein n=1 Tax=Hyella patelloides LEGE 07179 TaxID=945734 RepID=A0A563VL79_9CYAN|nr:chemotaxis protein CheW [Hyella patelloides]VEP12065.1 Chemotaxis signal transduction protein [Hyella patelloides LEGE 07179]
MIDSQSYLTFRLHELTYGIETHLVKEIFQLPELTIIPETPGDIIGVLYLRDRTIPVMHLDRRLGQSIQECRLSDRVIVIQWKAIEIGIIVNEVLDVINIESNFLEPEPDYGREHHINTAFINKIATILDTSIILLNTEALIRQPDEVAGVIAEADTLENQALEPEGKAPILSNFFDLYCPQTSEIEQDTFRQRTKELQLPLEIGETDGSIPLAVFSLGKEYLGCDLAVVKEFIDIDKVTPIPCCPKHIVGNINLRGEIIPLVDIRSVIHFAEAEKPATQAIIVQINDISAGIVVDEIFDVVHINQEQLSPTPTGVAAEIKKYFHGMAIYEKNLLSALDLAKIFAEGNLVVG